jgi:hypothetical protein
VKKTLTAEDFRSLLNYDPETGVLTWKVDRRGVLAGEVAGSILNHHSGKQYIYVRVHGRLYYAHRIAWAIYYGEEPPKMLDHRDSDSINNRIKNLRGAESRQNQYNKGLTARNTSGFKGVSFDKERGLWSTRINLPDGKQKFLGRYETPELAHAAYCKAASELHGEFARAA